MLAALRRHPVLAGGFALSAAVALWLLVSVGAALLGWGGRGPEPLAPWMTVGYVGRVNGLNPREIDAVAGFPSPEVAGHPMTLGEIALRRGVPVEEVYRELDAALRRMQGHGHLEPPRDPGEAPPPPPPGPAPSSAGSLGAPGGDAPP